MLLFLKLFLIAVQLKGISFILKNDEKMFFPHDLTTDVCLIKKNSLSKTETGQTKKYVQLFVML